MSGIPQLYDRARAALERSGFDADAQTKIALFVGAAKAINATMLAPYVLQPATGVAYASIHGQYGREVELMTLLGRATRWSADPLLYMQGARLVAPLWLEWSRIQLAGAPLFQPGAAYAALALGHALLARVRVAPVMGNDVDAFDPFVAALQRIEQDAGRMIQTQIRLLKDGKTPLDASERARIIDTEQGLVDAAFARLLEWLAGIDSAPSPPSRGHDDNAGAPIARNNRAPHRPGGAVMRTQRPAPSPTLQ